MLIRMVGAATLPYDNRSYLGWLSQDCVQWLHGHHYSTRVLELYTLPQLTLPEPVLRFENDSAGEYDLSPNASLMLFSANFRASSANRNVTAATMFKRKSKVYAGMAEMHELRTSRILFFCAYY